MSNKKKRNIVSGFMGSLSEWEDSYFGGYTKILWDYPEIKIEFKIEWDTKDKKYQGLSYYHYNKFIKIFLLKVKEYKMTNTLVADMLQERGKKYGKEIIKHTTNPIRVAEVWDRVTTQEAEIKNLFIHYEQLIRKTSFWYEEDVKNEQEQEQQDGPDQDSEPQEDQGKGKGSKSKSKPKESQGPGNKPIEQPAAPKPIPAQVLAEMIDKTALRKDEWANGWSWDSDNKPVFLLADQGSTTSYSRQEVLWAKQLGNLLDISFDPCADKIKSLRTGKIDSSKICEVEAGNFNINYRVEEDQITKPFSVCIIGDVSGSMGDRYRIFYQKQLLKVLYLTFSEILPPEKLYIYGLDSGDSGTTRLTIYQDRYNDNFEKSIESMKARGGSPYLQGIEAVHAKVREGTDDNIIFLFLTDGLPNGGPGSYADLKKLVEKCKRDGFVTIGVGIKAYAVKDIFNYHTIIRDPANELVRKTSMIINHVVKTEFQD